ncbi:MAG: aminopeptidase P N-terminal domain-containing protein [Fimbriimonadaceae bacterium]|nr:aminopeptidase P N-terminal domain-containing protein [Fimbriimonadaceae bacterium]
MIVASIALLAAYGPSQDYPIFETDFIPAAEHAQRRETLRSKMAPGSVAVFFANPEQNRNNDVDFQFRQDSNFLYLTGLNEPNAALLLAKDPIEVDGKRVREILFVEESNAQIATWVGYRMGSAFAQRHLKLDHAMSNASFAKALEGIRATTRYAPLGGRIPTGALARMMPAYRTFAEAGSERPSDLGRHVGMMRTIKSADEIRLLRRAIDASVEGHIAMMKTCTPTMREYELDAVFEFNIRKRGCEYTGYPSIIGSGLNSCILHYNTNRRRAEPGDIICIDAGGEYHGYTADVTRSFPVNGKFSAEQRALYDIVLKAQDAGIAECRVGKPFGATNAAAQRVVGEGLVKLGIIKNASEARRYFMHGTSHYLGLDVHDSHGYSEFQPNMVLTVEPGIYIKAGSPCDRKWWNIGIRIEDDILVTSGDPVNLSAKAPRRAEDVERLMAQPGMNMDQVQSLTAAGLGRHAHHHAH